MFWLYRREGEWPRRTCGNGGSISRRNMQPPSKNGLWHCWSDCSCNGRSFFWKDRKKSMGDRKWRVLCAFTRLPEGNSCDYRNSPAWQSWNSRIKTATVFAENSSDQLNVVRQILLAVRTTCPVASEFGIWHNAVRDRRPGWWEVTCFSHAIRILRVFSK